MKDYFTTFGIAEHFSSDMGPQFVSSQFQHFLKSWGIEHRTSSAYFPKSNLRSESAVKSAKRIVLDNSKLDGSPDMDKIARALMQHRNTPDSEYGISPSQLVFGRPIRDFLPVRPGDFSPSEVWIDNREKRELAMRKRIMRGTERWTEHTRDLPALNPGTRVLIQNQYGAGKVAKRWDKSGLVIENLGFNKYRVKVDRSGRVTDRNRQFLKQFTPVTPGMPGPTPNTVNPTPQPQSQIPINPTPVQHSERLQHFVDPTPSSPTPPAPQLEEIPNSPASPTFVTPPSSPVQSQSIPEASNPSSEPVALPETPMIPRRSTRVTKPPDRLRYDKF